MSRIQNPWVARVGKPAFQTLEQLDRWKRLLLALPVARIRGFIPWAYIPDKEKPDEILIPDVNAIRLLFKAREYLKSSSLVAVAAWLTAETGYSITSEGLRLLLIERMPFKEVMLPYEDRERIYRSPSDYGASSSYYLLRKARKRKSRYSIERLEADGTIQKEDTEEQEETKESGRETAGVTEINLSTGT